MAPIVLASSSPVRARLLAAAGVPFRTRPARIDEQAIRASLDSEGASPRDQADALAEMKARSTAGREPGALVIGCDQILDLDRVILAKPPTPDAARAQLRSLRARTHRLHSAVVIYESGSPVWRHLGEVKLTMRDFSDAFLDAYLARNADSILSSVGGYLLEEEGVRLFSRIEGDYFTALGLPLTELLGYLGQRGFIEA